MIRRKGFTLIELLVVIAIIALLMSILMPALNRVRKQARSVACRAQLKSWGMIFKLYTDDNDGQFNSGWDPAHGGERALFMNAMRPYYNKDMKMLLCPTATKVVNSAADWGTFKAWTRNVDMPEGGSYDYEGSYNINSWTNNMTADRGARPKEWFWRRTHNIKDPQNVPILADGTWHDAWVRDTDSPPPGVDDFGSGDRGTDNEMRHFCIDRHNGWNNFTFADWSVRPIGLKQLWTLKWHRNFNTRGAWTMTGNGGQSPDWPQWMRRYKDY
jgi:prepilin-type N-terminal cleavage/methylation domain-containing protein/prepilin-type processing-associated H-X9-DG protein